MDNQVNPQTPDNDFYKTAIYLGVIVLIIAAVIYWYYGSRSSVPAPENGAGSVTAADIPDLSSPLVNISEDVTPVNPVENVPDLNPAAAANPFSDVYQNPFNQ